MNAEELIKKLTRLEKYRDSIYLATEKIEQWYLLKVSQIVALDTGEVMSGKIEAGLLTFAKSEAGGEKTKQSKLAIDRAIVQGLVAEMRPERLRCCLIFLHRNQGRGSSSIILDPRESQS